MGYALFAQRKLVLDSQLNATQLQQTQRSNEQYQLATRTMSLQQQLSSLQANQALQLQPLYEEMANMKVNSNQFMVTKKDENGEEYQELDSLAYSTKVQEERGIIEGKINALQSAFKAEEDAINRDIYFVSIKENAIEMEVKRLETQVSALEKQLEKVEEAEGSAIDRATPQFKAK